MFEQSRVRSRKLPPGANTASMHVRGLFAEPEPLLAEEPDGGLTGARVVMTAGAALDRT
jgi:hypothetical protein